MFVKCAYMRIVVLILLWVGSAVPVKGQYLGNQQLSEDARISLLTIFPGDELYTAFGHTAIRVYDPASGLDVVYNYGTFDFGEPGFYWKFIRGELRYFLSRAPFALVYDHYREVERRAMVEQILRMNREKKQQLFTFLEENYRPENRYYAYDFFFDNCATRVRDVFERVLADHLAYPEAVEPPAPTFRRLLDPYMADRPFLHTGMDLLLGQPADAPASLRDAFFLPLILMQGIGASRVYIGETWEPFVAATDTLFWIEGAGIPEPVPDWPTMLLWGIFVLSVSVTVRKAIEGKVRPFSPWGDGMLFTVAGLIGVVLMFLWLGTHHRVAAPNWNLLWAWPTHLLVGMLIFRKRPFRSGWKSYIIAASLAGWGVILGWRWIPQELPAALFPFVLLLIWRMAWMTWLYAWFQPSITADTKPSSI